VKTFYFLIQDSRGGSRAGTIQAASMRGAKTQATRELEAEGYGHVVTVTDPRTKETCDRPYGYEWDHVCPCDRDSIIRRVCKAAKRAA